MHLANNGLFPPAHQGYFMYRSCLASSLIFHSDITRRVVEVKAGQTGFTKTFDPVSHRLLDHKQPAFGVAGSVKK